jgi:hypothetical protein
MAAMQGYSDGSFDYKQMYAMHDSRGSLPIPIVHPGTLMYELKTVPEFATFAALVEHTSLVGILNDPQASFTLFVPVNGGIPPEWLTANSYDIRRCVMRHMLEKPLPPQVLRGSRCMMLDTRVTGHQLLSEYQPAADVVVLDGTSHVVAYKQIGQSVVYTLDRILPMDRNPLSNLSI